MVVKSKKIFCMVVVSLALAACDSEDNSNAIADDMEQIEVKVEGGVVMSDGTKKIDTIIVDGKKGNKIRAWVE